MQTVACSKPLALETCSDSLWYFIGFHAEYLQYRRACHDSQTDPLDAPLNKTELSSPFNRKPHVIDQDFTEFNINANHFLLLDGKCRLLCGPAKYLHELVPVSGPAVENHWSRSTFITIVLDISMFSIKVPHINSVR